MREILFRGKQVDSGRWVYGVPVPIRENTYRTNRIELVDYVNYDELDNYYPFYNSEEVVPETVGQYTGLTDKNGKEIFEGDIVQADDGPCRGVHGVCHYGTNDDTCIGYYIRWIDDGENRWSEWWRQDLGYWNNKVTIIGNIYDNPELVGEQGK